MVYLPPAFTETQGEVLFAHLERHDFGLLIMHGTAGLIASQIPFVAERRGGKLYLQAHIARPNPQADHLDGGEALVIFSNTQADLSHSTPSGGGTGAADIARHLLRPQLPLG